MLKRKHLISLFLLTNAVLGSSSFCLAAGSGDLRQLPSITSVAGNIFNVVVGVAGLVLVVMIAYGVWKSSMAVGDPRGLEGAKQTWTYAVFGFFVVVGVVAGVIIMGKLLLGVTLTPSGFIGSVSGALNSLINPY
jgi:hypothetical protein